jgi:hypothetical protein
MSSQIDFDREVRCIGYCEGDGAPFPRVWFAHWFLELTGEGFTIDAPRVRYERDGLRIKRTRLDNGKQHIYMLTDEYDHVTNRRLGVWPD